MATKKTEEVPKEETVVEETVKEEPEKKAPVDETSDEYWNEQVPFYAFKDGDKYKDDIVVGVNGKIWQIKRGVEVMIPRFVKQVIIQSMEQDAQTAELIERQENAFAAEAKTFNI